MAEATWRVIRKAGMENATVRQIAQEAGFSPGFMRHYFSSQSELLAYAMNLVSDRVRRRIESYPFDGTPLANMLWVLGVFLPLDEERQAEMEVWLAFKVKSLTEPSLQELAIRVRSEMKAVMEGLILSLIESGEARPGLHADRESEPMLVYIDGLALHGLLYPDQMPPSRISELLELYVKSLCSESANREQQI
ncbi:TetR/AcrR family transcriptional regulator [Paenibacillus sinensis]|uniref:TetR/AcrR family transcriptional regulator n=1 Tax=Paenibacillus sinensis TaxID=2834413 RepID=UPI001F29D9F4|nr:TetR/AcrR family transcriptional regulator [Paenibacillus sinensis]